MHTPGPWRLAPGSEYRDSAVLNVDAGTRAFICAAGIRGDAEAEANARLISAAPDLLESLTNLIGLAEMRGPHLHEYKAAIDHAKAALEKAR
jgi:hypothetical protein